MAQPEYLRIAAELRRRISSGEFSAGDQIPTLPALSQSYRVSETIIRNALALLRNEGLIETRARAGTRVRQTPPVHRMAADRYRNKPGAPSTPDTRTRGSAGASTAWTRGSSGWRRRRNWRPSSSARWGSVCSRGTSSSTTTTPPTQMGTSYVSWGDVEGTPVADPIHEPWPGGTRAQMASLGIRVTRITESFTSGMPNENEAKTLRIGTGVPVLRHTRRHIADNGRIVEVAHPIVRRGDTTVVDFVIDLED